MEKKVMGISVTILIIVVTLCGCFENNNGLSGELSINQIKTNFINAFNNNISSYKCDITNNVNVTINNAEETLNFEDLSNTSLLVDISNHNLKQEIDYLNVGEDENDKRIVYIIDNFKYTGDGKEGNLSWEYDELSPQFAEIMWNITSPLDQFAEVTTNRIMGQDTNMTWKRLKDESFNNMTYYVLLSELIENNSDPLYTGYNHGEIYHTLWIDKTNFFLYKVKLNQIHDKTGSYAGIDDRRYLIGEDIFTFYDYNIPVNIELPPEVIQ
jgi:hypothetical protein